MHQDSAQRSSNSHQSHVSASIMSTSQTIRVVYRQPGFPDCWVWSEDWTVERLEDVVALAARKDYEIVSVRALSGEL